MQNGKLDNDCVNSNELMLQYSTAEDIVLNILSLIFFSVFLKKQTFNRMTREDRDKRNYFQKTHVIKDY